MSTTWRPGGFPKQQWPFRVKQLLYASVAQLNNQPIEAKFKKLKCVNKKLFKIKEEAWSYEMDQNKHTS